MTFVNIKLLLSTAVCALCWTSNVLSGQSCDAMLQDIEYWASNHTQGYGDYRVRFTMASNRADGRYVSYSEGDLVYKPESSSGLLLFSPVLEGQATQYFSDRRYVPPSAPSWAPFTPFDTDGLQVRISLRPVYGHVTFTLLRWGNAQFSVRAQCQNGLMYAWSGDTLFAISLTKSFVPPPR